MNLDRASSLAGDAGAGKDLLLRPRTLRLDGCGTGAAQHLVPAAAADPVAASWPAAQHSVAGKVTTGHQVVMAAAMTIFLDQLWGAP